VKARRNVEAKLVPLVDCLKEATDKGRLNLNNVVADWVNLSAYTMALVNGANLRRVSEIHERITEIKNKYSEKQIVLFTKALEILGELHERQTKDWLGQLTGVASLTENKDGQVFTPDYVAQLMSELVNTTSDIQETVSDPCCGTGALLLGHIARVREKDNKQSIRMHAIDLDRTALLCTFIQCGLHGVNGVFIVGNTLTNEVYETFYSALLYY